MPAAGVDFDRICDHEDGVETDTELADQILVALAALLEGIEELLGAGMRDGAEIRNELVVGHADTEVLDRDGSGLLIRGNLDLQIKVRVEDVLLGDLSVAQLLRSVRRIGY